MGIAYNSKIITDGLVLCLDAANPKSYPGSGTTWYDLSGNKNNASMYGTVPFSTDVTSCFDFSTVGGTYSYSATMGFSLSTGVNPATGNYTFEFWIKNPNASGSQLGLFSNSGGGDGFRYGMYQTGWYALCGPTYTEGNVNYSSSFDNNKWHHIVMLFDRNGTLSAGNPRIYTYLDGTYQTNFMSLPTSQTTQYTGAPGIVRSACCTTWTGKLSTIRVYHSLLSSSSILTNYNAAKGRFGL